MTPERAKELASRLSDADREEIEQTAIVCGRGGCERMGSDPAAPFRSQLAAERSARAKLAHGVRVTLSFMEDAPELWGNPASDTAMLGLRGLLDQQRGLAAPTQEAAGAGEPTLSNADRLRISAYALDPADVPGLLESIAEASPASAPPAPRPDLGEREGDL